MRPDASALGKTRAGESTTGNQRLTRREEKETGKALARRCERCRAWFFLRAAPPQVLLRSSQSVLHRRDGRERCTIEAQSEHHHCALGSAEGQGSPLPDHALKPNHAPHCNCGSGIR